MASVAKRKREYKGKQRIAWVCRWTDQFGKKRLKTFHSEKNAERYRAKVTLELERSEHIGPTGEMIFDDAVEHFLDDCEARVTAGDGLRAQTLRQWRLIIKNYIQPKFGKYRLREVTPREVQKWLNALRYDRVKPMKRDGLLHRAVILRAMFRFAEREELCRDLLKGEFPEIPDASKKKMIAFPTREEVRQL